MRNADNIAEKSIGHQYVSREALGVAIPSIMCRVYFRWQIEILETSTDIRVEGMGSFVLADCSKGFSDLYLEHVQWNTV